MTHDIKLSKSLSYVLRHGAEREGILMRNDGFVAVKDLLQHPRFKRYTLAKIQEVVDNNDKKRFLLAEENGEWYIRANQGHSLIVEDLELTKINSPDDIPVVVHGTYLRNWESIAKKGLLKMNRNHIHFAPGLAGEDGVISGMRKSAEVFIYIDAKKAMADGIEFFRSANGVILTEGQDGVLKTKYFEKVVQRNGAKLV
ncbi:uncharacterized protein VTP21DRAFT_11017 [Calcarisporiella thermophila]|uniref:uncharacterized protein n=1 Tax=Calcarisporiella thermophila TaxID=911321 RepID=UPI0037440458